MIATYSIRGSLLFIYLPKLLYSPHDGITFLFMGAWPTSLVFVPLVTVVLMIGCNGRNHHSLLTALRYIPDDRIKYVAIVLRYHMYIFPCYDFSLSGLWPSFVFSFEF